ncbi:MAG: SelB C-terminal domain-containing protein, partial [Lachnospiraceae bacterium]|nr:SelB C-terminal domain-containing protein [Lachnospiraceae bacterium]
MRTALLLNNVKAEDIRRGMVIAKPDSIIPTTRIAAYITMVKKTEKVLKNQQKVHVHVGTDEVIGRVKLLDADVLSEGESGFAEVVLEREIVVKRRDRFVIRFLSPLDTIGGGTVLIANSDKLKRNDEAILGKLKVIHEDKSKEHILNIVRESDKMPIKISKLLALSELSKDTFDKEIDEIKVLNELFIFSTKKEECFFTFKAEDALRQSIVEYFKELYTKRPYAVYESINTVKAKFFKGFEPLIIDGYLERLCEDSVLSIDGVNVRLFDRECPKDEVYKSVLNKLRTEFEKAGTDFADVKNINLIVSDEDRADLISEYVVRGEIVMINDDFYTTPDIARMIENKVLEFFEDNEVISFASLRDLLGTSRRSAKPLMAYLDNVGITKWSGKETERVKK